MERLALMAAAVAVITWLVVLILLPVVWILTRLVSWRLHRPIISRIGRINIVEPYRRHREYMMNKLTLAEQRSQQQR